MGSMEKLLVATTNQGKLVEIRALLAHLPVEIYALPDLGIHFHVDEDGATYAENAAKKGLAYARASGLLTLSDDSGLEVEALEGAPGLYSARFSPRPNAQDADRRAYLLEQLRSFPRPWQAQFRCVVALVTPEENIHYAEGICPGEIIPEERGQNGFGYDPIFLLPELDQTMAELKREVKNRLSHRGRAVLAALPALSRLIQTASI